MQEVKIQEGIHVPRASERSALFAELQDWYKSKKSSDLKLQNLLLDQSREQEFILEGDDYLLDYSKQNLNHEAMEKLIALYDKLGVERQIQDKFGGKAINATERRAVLHTALRASKDEIIDVDGYNVVTTVQEELQRILKFSDQVRKGEILGATGKRIKTILSIGIGGSYLGVMSCYQAFRNTREGFYASRDYTMKFLADPDPIDWHQQKDGLDPESTLVIILSKTFTTSETILNATTVREWFISSLHCTNPSLSEKQIISSHFCAVSTELAKTSKFGIIESRVFCFWDWVGGRFSVSSAIGMLPLSIVFGRSVIEEFLGGMRNIDHNFKNEKDPKKNASILLGLIGFYNRTIQHYQSKAILPYSQGLSSFFNHIQQVSMESNGKRVDIFGDELNYGTGYVVFGESGTKGQHSFFQLLHQGKLCLTF